MKNRKTSQLRPPVQNQTRPPQRLLAFSARRMLTEKSSVSVNLVLLNESTEQLTMRATIIAATTTEIPGYSHYGLND